MVIVLQQKLGYYISYIIKEKINFILFALHLYYNSILFKIINSTKYVSMKIFWFIIIQLSEHMFNLY